MGTMIDTLQTATGEMHNTDARDAKTHLSYTLDTGLTCLLVLAITLCMNIGFEMFKGISKQGGSAQKPESPSMDRTQNADPKRVERGNAPIEITAPDKQSHGTFVKNTVRQYHELQREELRSYQLTHAEQRIAILMLLGETNKDIAERTHMAESTVKKHVQKILTKTGTTNRKALSHLIQRRIVKKAN